MLRDWTLTATQADDRVAMVTHLTVAVAQQVSITKTMAAMIERQIEMMLPSEVQRAINANKQLAELVGGLDAARTAALGLVSLLNMVSMTIDNGDYERLLAEQRFQRDLEQLPEGPGRTEFLVEIERLRARGLDNQSVTFKRLHNHLCWLVGAPMEYPEAGTPED